VGPCSDGPIGQEEVGKSSQLLVFGCRVVGCGVAQGDLAGLQMSESTWAANCPATHLRFQRGCRQVSPIRQPIVQ
jgi:hypothetical protein